MAKKKETKETGVKYTCSSCRFFAECGPWQGTCRRRSPEPSPHAPGEWPYMTRWEWCGEWQSLDAKEDFDPRRAIPHLIDNFVESYIESDYFDADPGAFLQKTYSFLMDLKNSVSFINPVESTYRYHNKVIARLNQINNNKELQ
jgi:hypothetical protein